MASSTSNRSIYPLKLGVPVGRGSYGSVYLAKNVLGCNVAAKVIKRAKPKNFNHEVAIMKLLRPIAGKWVPRLLWSGDISRCCSNQLQSMTEEESNSIHDPEVVVHSSDGLASVKQMRPPTALHPRIQFSRRVDGVIVMSLCGPSLEDVRKRKPELFTWHNVMSIGEHLIKGLEAVHSLGVVLCDVKPENFCIAHHMRASDVTASDLDRLILVDFGLATKVTDANGKHTRFKTDQSFTGTPMFASNNAHSGFRLSRRDDLISLGLCLMYMIEGTLPWETLHDSRSVSSVSDKQLHEDMKKAKILFDPEIRYPQAQSFHSFWENVCTLSFDETPRYGWLCKMLRASAQEIEVRESSPRVAGHESGIWVSAE